MEKEFIYISGKVTGLNRIECYEKFLRAEKVLRDEGFETINPMRHIPKGMEWSKAMKVCLVEMMKCDNIYMLKDWKDSNGSRIELGLAIRLGYNIIYEKIESNDMVHIVAMN